MRIKNRLINLKNLDTETRKQVIIDLAQATKVSGGVVQNWRAGRTKIPYEKRRKISKILVNYGL